MSYQSFYYKVENFFLPNVVVWGFEFLVDELDDADQPQRVGETPEEVLAGSPLQQAEAEGVESPQILDLVLLEQVFFFLRHKTNFEQNVLKAV